MILLNRRRTSSATKALWLLLAVAGKFPIVLVQGQPRTSGTITPLLEEGEIIHTSTTVNGPDKWSTQSSLRINSPLHVTLMRYHDGDAFYLSGGAPLYENEVHILVKSSKGCSDADVNSIVANIETHQNEENDWYSDSVTITVDSTDTSEATAEARGASTFDGTMEYPNPTAFNAKWNYTSFWCVGRPPEDLSCPPTTMLPTTMLPRMLPTSSPIVEKVPTASPEDPSIEIGEPTESPTITPAVATARPSSNVVTAVTSGGSNRSRRPTLSMTIIAMVIAPLMAMLYTNNGNTKLERSPLMVIVCCVGIIALSAVLVASNVEVDTVDTPKRRNLSQPDDITKYIPRKLGSNQDTASSTTCTVGVEILYDGCFQKLAINAPSVRVVDVVVEDASDACEPTDPCTTNYEANFEFPLPVNNDGEPIYPVTTQTILAEDGVTEYVQYDTLDASPEFLGFCGRAVEGRPFVDDTGHALQATAVEVESTSQDNSWSKVQHTQDGLLFHPSFSDDKDTEAELFGQPAYWQLLAEEWTRRALGEHSSIASFAA